MFPNMMFLNPSWLDSFRRRFVLPNLDFLVAFVLLVTGLGAEYVWADPPSPQAGYQFLTEKAYLPPDFDQQTLDAVWKEWPEPLRSQARESSLLERRRMIFNRYGLTPRPDTPPTDESLKPLQYVVSPQGEWSMNCFACHGGRVGDQVVPGAPNSDFALAMLTADIRQTKLRLGKRLGHMDVGSLFMPLGTTRGSTNAVMFGVALLAYRDDDLNLLPKRFPPPMVHHDMDAPPWWHFQRKQALYIDGFAPKSHRPLMQFMLVEQNGPEKFAEWESDFRDVQAYISSIQPPRYPFPINEETAAQGRVVFANHCAECHGTYGAGAHYPERMVAWDEVRTDRVRLQALSPAARARYGRSWFAVGHSAGVIADPPGYVAPPLDGLWASAPYLHNGSVPTLWHLLRPEQRPDRWRKSGSQIDPEHVGLTISTDSPVEPIQDPVERHAWFDTRRYGKSATGHDFPANLTEEEKSVLLEYLKTL